MRHPSFEGMRIDKNAKDIKPEKETHTEEIVSINKKTTMKKKAVDSKENAAENHCISQ